MFDAYSLFFSKYGCSIFVINKSLISISQHIVDDHDRRQTQVVNCQISAAVFLISYILRKFLWKVLNKSTRLLFEVVFVATCCGDVQ